MCVSHMVYAVEGRDRCIKIAIFVSLVYASLVQTSYRRVTMKSILKKGKVKSTFIYLCMLFEEFHVRFGGKYYDGTYAKFARQCSGYHW
jgi:hypothetical protein